ncbi:MAG: FAD-binding oxidoreductase [Myxococcota bacterium]
MPLPRRSFLASTAAASALFSTGRARAWAPSADTPTGLDELAKRFGAKLVQPTDATYDHVRRVRNHAFDSVRPAAIVLADSVEDVRDAVQWAAAHDMPIVPRCGGHSYVGQSTSDGLVVNLQPLAGIDVDTKARTAEVGGGAINIDVNVALLQKGVALPTGSCPSVGIAGLTLGGGIGFSGRKWGLMCDNLIGVQMVLASGKVVEADETALPELLWACRGGAGGNFGIVTKFRFRVHEVEPVSTYSIKWPWTAASAVLDAWQRWAPHAPDGLFSVCTLTKNKTTPSIGSHGRFFGTKKELEALIEPLLAAAEPRRSRVSARTLWSGHVTGPKCWPDPNVCHGFNHPQPGRYKQTSYVVKSDYFNRNLSEEGRDTLIRWIEKGQDQAITWGGVILDSLGGAINRVPKHDTAYVHRDSLIQAEYVAHWRTKTKAAKVAANKEWMRQMYDAMRPHASGECYQNYPDLDLKDWASAYFGDNLPRLQQCKDIVDPGGLFRGRQILSPTS